MVTILLATADTQIAKLVRDTLGAQGWWVTLVERRQSALRSAADQAPLLVMVDSLLPDAEELVRVFSTRTGGPGAVLLAPIDPPREPTGEAQLALEAALSAAAEWGADQVIRRPPTAAELTEAARQVMEKPHKSSGPAAPPSADLLTSEDIFGDVLAAVGEEPAAAEEESVEQPEPADEIPEPEVAEPDADEPVEQTADEVEVEEDGDEAAAADSTDDQEAELEAIVEGADEIGEIDELEEDIEVQPTTGDEASDEVAEEETVEPEPEPDVEPIELVTAAGDEVDGAEDGALSVPEYEPETREFDPDATPLSGLDVVDSELARLDDVPEWVADAADDTASAEEQGTAPEPAEEPEPPEEEPAIPVPAAAAPPVEESAPEEARGDAIPPLSVHASPAHVALARIGHWPAWVRFLLGAAVGLAAAALIAWIVSWFAG